MKRSLTFLIGLAVSALVGSQTTQALTVTQAGTFANDNQVFQYNFTLPSATSISFFTTSYAGGVNLDGTTSAAGGFVPNLTLFSASGNVIAADGGSSTPRGSLRMDPVTRLYNDAYIATTLTAGSYILTLTEFPNVAIGNFSDGFLFATSPNITGQTCGNASGKFLETDTAPCVQRSSGFAVNVNTPEPATFFLVIPALGVAYLCRRRQAVVS